MIGNGGVDDLIEGWSITDEAVLVRDMWGGGVAKVMLLWQCCYDNVAMEMLSR
jgi:hypothetical protein